MFDRVAKLLGFESNTADNTPEHGVALATAALMVRVSHADGDFTADEADALKRAMVGDFGLSAAEADHILNEATEAEQDANCLYRFTRVITSELDQDGRQEIVRALWRVALADGVVDNFEDNILAKIAGLLGVIPADRIRLKHAVQAERKAG